MGRYNEENPEKYEGDDDHSQVLGIEVAKTLEHLRSSQAATDRLSPAAGAPPCRRARHAER